jgi:hypothetical protein
MRRAHHALVWILTACGLALVSSPAAGSQTPASPSPASDAAREARLAWWREARFGLFMHWGIYAVPAGEWKGLEKQRDLGGEWIMQRAQIPVKEYELLALHRHHREALRRLRHVRVEGKQVQHRGCHPVCARPHAGARRSLPP